MEDRCIDDFSNIGGVVAGSLSVRRGREADLVIDDNMHRATDFVILKGLHL